MRQSSLFLPAIFCLFMLYGLVAAAPIHAQSTISDDKTHPWYVSTSDYKHARNAKHWAKRERWGDTQFHANKAKDRIIYKFFLWNQYTSGSKRTSFADITRFIRQNPHWPNQDLLKQRAEEAIKLDTDKKAVIAWFTEEKRGKERSFRDPTTPRGKLALAEALLQEKDNITVKETFTARLLREAWIYGNFTKNEERDFLKKHAKQIRVKDYTDRVERLLWERKTTPARRILKAVNPAYKALFEARIKLIGQKFGVDKAVAKVPEKLQRDPGLLYDRVRWRRARGNKEGVIELLKLVPSNPPYPKKWWALKKARIRDLVEDKRYRGAYQLVVGHGLTEGIDFAEAEWMGGWIALSFLNQPKWAYRHFYALYHGVKTPISLARGAYWAGRAAEKNNSIRIARSWYHVAKQHPTTFYGQLAARKLNRRYMELPEEPKSKLVDLNYYYENELLKAAFILHNIGYRQTTKKFIKAAIRNAKSAGEVTLISRLGLEISHPAYSVIAGKEVSKSGVVLLKPHYPTLPTLKHPRTKKPITKPELPLIHAITMQESLFNKEARSSAGARGLMQLMPGTARLVARKERLRYRRNRLTSDAAYNVALGSRYLSDMVEKYDGSYILAIAAYNAGPHNVNKWLKRFGDPRNKKSVEDVITWMEQIPFRETRNYVQRVTENLQLYRFVLSDKEKGEISTDRDIKR